jgi:hypothetical protein
LRIGLPCAPANLFMAVVTNPSCFSRASALSQQVEYRSSQIESIIKRITLIPDRRVAGRERGEESINGKRIFEWFTPFNRGDLKIE